MNETIQTILSHSSVRSFKNMPLTKNQVIKLMRSSQAASSASFQQAYSIIGISEKLLK